MTTPPSAAVQLDTEVLDQLVRHIRDKTTDTADAMLMIPTAHFTSPERAQAEIELLRRLPLIVGHVSEITKPGAFVTRELLGIPLLIVRQRDDSIAVFRNVCLHRGGRVEMAVSGTRQVFMCQYHGWSYAANGGELKTVPYAETSGGVNRDCNGLLRYHAEIRHGLIFATLSDSKLSDATPRSVAEHLGPEVDAQIEPWDMAGNIVYMDHVLPQPINWKLVMDGAIDSLHAQFLHSKPGGVGARSVNHATVFKEFGPHGKMHMARRRLQTMIEAGQEPDANSRNMASVMMIYPNNIFVEAPDHIELWSVWPDLKDPSACTVRIRFMVRESILTPEMEERINKSWEILRDAATEEDFPMEETIQKSAEIVPDGFYRYGRNEKPAQHLHRQLHRDIDGNVEGPGTLRFVH